MRDGVVLYADVYLPVGEGKYPVLVSRTPYSTERAPNAWTAPVWFARRGYVYVFQDVRGRHESEGTWEPYRHEMEDGYDTIEWAARQPWSNGKVGMQGGSYLGHVQWFAAAAAPPHLVTIFPGLAAASLYRDRIVMGGAWRLSANFGWGAMRQHSRIMQNVGVYSLEDGPDGLSFDKTIWKLPLVEMPKLLGRDPAFYRDWIAHPDFDGYWKKIDAAERFEKITIPVHAFGGLFDIMSRGTIGSYTGISRRGGSERARRESHMVIGPWGHGPTRKFGDLDFGEQAHLDTHTLELRWFDYWLKGVDTGVRDEPPVKIFVSGRNQWRLEREYPLAQTRYTEMYLESGGQANSSRGNGRLVSRPPAGGSPADRYTYDPDSPVPSLGGNNCCGTPTPAGPRDQRPLEGRSDVLVYTSDVLDRDLEVVGPVKVILHAASDAVDTDFVAKLIDVHPDGRAIAMAEGILRARYRDDLSSPKLLVPGAVYKLTINLVDVSNVFLRGHRLRVDIASSHFPQFDRNPNTGEPFGLSAAVKVAHQTVYHSTAHPSSIVLPVIP